MYVEQIFYSALLLINIVSFLVMAHDKRRSRQGEQAARVSEGLIFFMATVFGSVGVYLSMVAFRHKTRKWYFQIGIPLLILQNAATLYVVWQVLVA